MNRRSLLDYIDDKEMPPAAPVQQQGAARLEQRLAELESRLAATRAETEATRQQPFSTRIESILKRQPDRLPQPAVTIDMPVPARTYPSRNVSQPPQTAAISTAAEHSLEFTKFVEAVHLIGQAAKRFLHEPAAPRQTGPSEDTLALTTALKETIGAFQAMTADLAKAAIQMRQAAPAPQERVEAPVVRPRPREEDELRRLERDLADLRERLAALSRRRTNY
jgi:hypothetical protein